MSLLTLNPKYEGDARSNGLATRIQSLEGLTVGLLDNNKKLAGEFLTEVEALLNDEHGAAKVIRVHKDNQSAPAPADIIAQLTACDVMMTAMGDCGSCSSSSMHDALSCELAGVPSIAIITEPFVQTAELVASIRGMGDYPFAVLEHPVANNSQEELREKARIMLDQAMRILTEEPGHGAGAAFAEASAGDGAAS